MESIRNSMIGGGEVFLRGFGSFIVKKQVRKAARNISKNTAIVILERSIPAFRPARSSVAKLE